MQTSSKVIGKETAKKEDDEPEAEVMDEYFKSIFCWVKEETLKKKISEACKEINYHNLLVLIAVRDYTVNKARNIQMVAKKCGLSFSAIQWTMSQKRDCKMARHSVLK